MTIYYLYVKTHNITGLQYLGYTSRKYPHKYTGSGKYWNLHLRKHGYNYNTRILHKCVSKLAIKAWGLFYSKLWSVVDSNKWANLIPETGEGGPGGKTGIPRSEQTKQKIRQNKPDQSGANNGMFNKTHTDAAKRKCGDSNRGKDIKTESGRKSIQKNMIEQWGDDEYRNKQIAMLRNRKGEKRSPEAIVSYKEAAKKRDAAMTKEERVARTLKGIETKKIKYAGLTRKRVTDEAGKIKYIWVNSTDGTDQN